MLPSMKVLVWTLSGLALVVLGPALAAASCSCACVEQQARPICSNSLEIAPPCPANVCPLATPMNPAPPAYPAANPPTRSRRALPGPAGLQCPHRTKRMATTLLISRHRLGFPWRHNMHRRGSLPAVNAQRREFLRTTGFSGQRCFSSRVSPNFPGMRYC
jgi:hypothetical protein